MENLGLLPHADAMRVMDEAHDRVVRGESAGVIIVVQHPAVVTMGNRFLAADLLLPPEALAAKDITFAKTDRGGSVTVHEPGQVVIYPVLRLGNALGAKAFVHGLEDAMISVCAAHGITAGRDAINPGVWVGSDKIGAIGIRVADRVTKHGLAFNVCNGLDTFAAVVPCGIRGRGVTTLARACGWDAEEGARRYADVEAALVRAVRDRLSSRA